MQIVGMDNISLGLYAYEDYWTGRSSNGVVETETDGSSDNDPADSVTSRCVREDSDDASRTCSRTQLYDTYSTRPVIVRR